MKRSLLYIIIAASIGALTACDEGDIVDEIFVSDAETYTVKFTAVLHGLDAWGGGYDIAVAAFDDASEYSVIQKQVVTDETGRAEIVLSGVPQSARTIEFCATNKLRRRIVTFESLTIDRTEMAPSDTICLNLATPIDVGMFATIQRYIFDGTAYNCSLCHGAGNGRAGLDLTAGHSYGNLFNVSSSRVADGIRVVPGDADGSVLHQALAEGNPAALRYDHSGLLDEPLRRLIDDWISLGAKE